MKKLTLNQKLASMIAILWLGLWMICGFGAWHSRTEMLVQRRAQLTSLVQQAVGVATHYHDLAQSSVMTEADAKKAALEAISAMRYGSDGYVSINDSHAVIIMHPIKPELNGKDESGMADPDGMHVFVEAAKAAQNPGGGFIDYMWPKPGASAPVGKISYTARFAPWDWCLLSGMYVDDIDAGFMRNLGLWLMITLVLGGVTTVVMIVVLRSVQNTLGGPLESAIATALRITDGDLTSQVGVKGNNPASLMNTLSKMQANLADTVSHVRTGSDNINVAANEIAAGNIDLSQRTEQQAASLEETAASMEQLTGTVRQNAENARQASSLAANASEVAAQGNEVMSQVTSTMQQITSSSSKIAEIIGMIDSIAFQTNILALNAAVEAARAGEQGRGFAVVAAEVRTLAQRSASAAKEIKALIDTSVAQVGEGSKLVSHAGATMSEIIAAVSRVTDIMGEIAAASDEQSKGIDQVGQAVAQMDQVTQQNAALVEQAAAAAQSMKDQAGTLQKAINVFRLAGNTSRLVDTDRPALALPGQFA